MDEFFTYVSKGVIIIPIVIVILSLIFKFNQNSSPVNKIIPTLTPTPVKINKLKIDFNNPLYCKYKDGSQEYKLSIMDKKVTLETITNGKSQNKDLSSYIPFIEGIINTTDVIDLEKMVKQYTGKSIDIEKVLKSCKSEDF